jgi:hypothetical protein
MANLSLQTLLEMKSGAIQEVTQEGQGLFSQYVESLEWQYWERDGAVAMSWTK